MLVYSVAFMAILGNLSQVKTPNTTVSGRVLMLWQLRYAVPNMMTPMTFMGPGRKWTM